MPGDSVNFQIGMKRRGRVIEVEKAWQVLTARQKLYGSAAPQHYSI